MNLVEVTTVAMSTATEEEVKKIEEGNEEGAEKGTAGRNQGRKEGRGESASLLGDSFTQV